METNNIPNNISLNNSTPNIICPVCGTVFIAANANHHDSYDNHDNHNSHSTCHHSSEGSNEDTTQTITHSPLVTKKAIQKRLDALAKAGEITDEFFTSLSPDSKFSIPYEDETTEEISADSPLFKEVLGQHTVYTRRLYRRWVMAQMLRLLERGRNLVDLVTQMGGKYQWKIILDELRTQKLLVTRDRENFRIRNYYFGLDAITWIMCEELREIRASRSFQRLTDSSVFVELSIALINRMQALIDNASNTSFTPAAYDEAIEIVNSFIAALKTVPNYKRKTSSACFADAYLGVGAYYTMQNLILFHGCRFTEHEAEKKTLIGSLKKLDSLIDTSNTAMYARRYRATSLMLELLRTNNFNYPEKKREWREAKQKSTQRTRVKREAATNPF